MKIKLSEIIGWYGMIAILIAYGLTNFHLISTSDLTYQLLNLTGAIGLAVVAYRKKAYQLLILNTIWTGIALYGLFT